MAAQSSTPILNSDKLNAFLSKAVQDMGAAMHAALILIGDKLGLYKAMAGSGPLTPAELAARTGTDERYVREWLNAHAASGYVEYDPTTQTYVLPPEQSFVLTSQDLPGAFHMIASVFKDEPGITDVFRTGRGVGWHEHDRSLFEGCERFFRPNYAAHLISEWIPSLGGVEQKLRAGGRIADVGCGHGSSSILMAEAYPNSHVFGFDYHRESIERAKEAAAQAGVAERVTFAVAPSKSFPGDNYDLVTFFDCLHDMGDPVGAAQHVREVLAEDGTWMIVEPFAQDRVELNLNPVGRIYYSASTMICTPASRSQEVGLALGAQAGEAKLREVVLAGGFGQFRRASETPFNLVFEAKR